MILKKRNITVVTGNRSDYGHLFWILKEIQKSQKLHLQLIATGQHISKNYGETHKEILKDGFKILKKVDLQLSDDSPLSRTQSMGKGLIQFAKVFHSLKSDILLLLGDRYEIFIAAQAAMMANIPIAHIHGGEITQGVIDEAIRHALTKMSHIHFVAAEAYRHRVIQLGESPNFVFLVGAPGLESYKKSPLLSRQEVECKLGLQLRSPLFLVTYHPLTLEDKKERKGIFQLLRALNHFPDAHIIFTQHNSDPRSEIIEESIHRYIRNHSDRCMFFTSLGQSLYGSVLKNSDVLIGNSSSGIIEAPVLKKPTVNIGKRQEGRLKARSIIDCKENETAIVSAIQKALSSDFQSQLKYTQSLYEIKDTSKKMCKILENISLDHILFKKFYDIKSVSSNL